MKADLNDISLFDLDSQTVLLITKFVRCVRDQENVALKLTDGKIVRKVFDIGMTTSKPEVKLLFLKIRDALRLKGQVADVQSKGRDRGTEKRHVVKRGLMHDDNAAA